MLPVLVESYTHLRDLRLYAATAPAAASPKLLFLVLARSTASIARRLEYVQLPSDIYRIELAYDRNDPETETKTTAVPTASNDTSSSGGQRAKQPHGQQSRPSERISPTGSGGDGKRESIERNGSKSVGGADELGDALGRDGTFDGAVSSPLSAAEAEATSASESAAAAVVDYAFAWMFRESEDVILLPHSDASDTALHADYRGTLRQTSRRIGVYGMGDSLTSLLRRGTVVAFFSASTAPRPLGDRPRVVSSTECAGADRCYCAAVPSMYLDEDAKRPPPLGVMRKPRARSLAEMTTAASSSLDVRHLITPRQYWAAAHDLPTSDDDDDDDDDEDGGDDGGDAAEGDGEADEGEEP